ncbi:MAG: hypothetical protein ABEJ27_00370, partial [Halodesulfurarchaeum sp.]
MDNLVSGLIDADYTEFGLAPKGTLFAGCRRDGDSEDHQVKALGRLGSGGAHGSLLSHGSLRSPFDRSETPFGRLQLPVRSFGGALASLGCRQLVAVLGRATLRSALPAVLTSPAFPEPASPFRSARESEDGQPIFLVVSKRLGWESERG